MFTEFFSYNLLFNRMVFYQLANADSTPIVALSFTTGFGSEGDWIAYENDGSSFLQICIGFGLSCVNS
jgi:hypothetical protein